MPPKGKKTLTISQAEVNRVLQTIHKNAGTTAQMNLQKTTIAAAR